MTRKSRTSRASFSEEDPTTVVTLPAEEVQHPKTLDDGFPLPKVIVFDLDYTLWPFWVDTHPSPPLRKSTDGGLTVRDAYGGRRYGFYNEVAGILTSIKNKGIKIGCASRTETPDLAREMLSLLRIPAEGSSQPALGLFDYLEMYPGSKTRHLQRIQKSSGVPYEEMLFFDDESRNRNVEDLGVVFQLVRDGVTRTEVAKGIENWRKKNNKTQHREG